MRDEANLAQVLGVRRDLPCFEDLPAGFVDWAQEFTAMEQRLDNDVRRRLRDG